MFAYGKYKNSRDAAWRCLLDNQVKQLPVSVSDIARRNGIRLGAYSRNREVIEKLGFGRYLDNNGFTMMTASGIIIMYSDGCNSQVSRFTVAHELGHIFLGHIINGAFDGDDQSEHEANVFASRVLAPACVLWGANIHTAEDIAKLCDISLTAARIRAERMEVLYKREAELVKSGRMSCFLQSQLERQVYRNFEEYIKQQKMKGEG